tara:strand:- start:39 stop:710 length:672 start_codon:yes stop_codon:yes gene_type:complete
MSIKFANNAHSTLASGINTSATSITVASGHGARFPSLAGAEFFFATLIDSSNNLEIVKATARSTDVLTVTRAQESTTARSFSSGDRIELRITAAGLGELITPSNIVFTNTNSTFTKAQRGSTQTANATGSTTLDFDTYQNFVLTATGNVTLANPSTEAVGQSGIIVLIQDGTGSRTLSLGTDYETAGGSGLTISTAASAVDVIPYFVKASDSIQLGAPQLAFA